MANLAQALKTEIARIAKKEARLIADPIRKTNSTLRTDVAKLKRLLSAQDREIAALKKGAAAKSISSKKQADDNQETKHRISAKGVKSLRAKLGLTAEQLGSLVGVSGQTVYLWESGKTSPRARAVAGLAKLRTMGKKDAQILLEAASPPAKKASKATRRPGQTAGRKATSTAKSAAPRKQRTVAKKARAATKQTEG